MLDLFTIFSKGGIVLWCCQATAQSLTTSVNALIKSVILQERGGLESFTHEALTIKYHLDNEFELVFVIGYQKFLQLSYVDKFLTDIQMEFRNKYKDDLLSQNVGRDFSDFTQIYKRLLQAAEESSKIDMKAPKEMRRFEQSDKSQKSVDSMIVSRGGKDDDGSKAKKKNKKDNKSSEAGIVGGMGGKGENGTGGKGGKKKDSPKDSPRGRGGETEEVVCELDEETIAANKLKLLGKFSKSSSKADITKAVSEPKKSPEATNTKKSKVLRQWDLNGSSRDVAELNFSKEKDESAPENLILADSERQLAGQGGGQIRDFDAGESSDSGDDDDDGSCARAAASSTGRSSGSAISKNSAAATKKPMDKTNGKSGGGRFSFLSGLTSLVGSKTITRSDIQPALEKMKDHLIAKNVASEIAEKLCDSIATKLEGKVLGTFSTVSATVKQALNEACVQLLVPKRRIDILRDAMDAQNRKSPYVITFCGVNGVGKSTNLAKVCFWLIENGLRVLIAACDTFRAGAVEQLRTHVRKLNAIHPPSMHNGLDMVKLYEKGYGKDAAGIAMEAIHHARDQRVDVVLIDTAGRMQDNEPLMRSLAKLIKVNEPDLVLFVGEALVGNEAVDQLVKFNQALADHSSQEKPHLIDGIVLTKFDTIDDKVGAAISMTYITGQPIMFVGTGQTYTDLKNLNARSVVHSLLKP